MTGMETATMTKIKTTAATTESKVSLALPPTSNLLSQKSRL